MQHEVQHETPLELTGPDGKSAWVSVCVRALDQPGRHFGGHVINLRDISEQRRQSEKLEKEIAALESYAHSVSHDLRSPLVSLLGFTRLLRQDCEQILDESGLHFLDRIEQAGRTMNMLVRDLLELSRLDHAPMRRAAIDPRNVLLQIHAELKPRLEEQGVDIVLPAAPPLLHCDQTQLYQIFSNLIGNALQHMGDCEAPQIRVEISKAQGQGIIMVSDNGEGIPTSCQERIFDVFHKGKRHNGTDSTGIGLSIVKKIALAHEGCVWVESKPGRGATFYVSIPQP